MVYTVLNNISQLFTELCLVHIMLVLTDANGFWIDLYKLGQRILQAARHGCGTSLPNIKIRKFLGGESGCGINGSTGFVYDYVLYRKMRTPDEIGNDLFGFAACGSISQRNNIYMIFPNQLFNHTHGLGNFILRCSRINNSGIQNLTGRIHDGNFTPGTECRIPA